MQIVLEAVIGRFQTKGLINPDHPCLAENSDSLQGQLFSTGPFDPLVDLVDRDYGRDYLLGPCGLYDPVVL